MEVLVMKLATFLVQGGRRGRFGALLGDQSIVDLQAAGRVLQRRIPRDLMACIRSGTSALTAVGQVLQAVEAEQAHTKELAETIYARDSVRFLPPIIPGKIMAVGLNYADHAAEVGSEERSRPSGFIKLTSSIIGHDAPIRKPTWTKTLDYENELAVVIGRQCANIPVESAYQYIFGYTIMNDVSAREVQRQERQIGNIMIGKNFPTSAPLGPWIVTRDEIPDPHNLQLITRVNGEIRQRANTKQQIHDIKHQMAWYSHAGFEPGDIVSTGTPSGVAAGHQGPESWYLTPGDEVSCEIEGIGCLRNPVRRSRTVNK
jgi:2-keto-4-pentenoate hydratase/2-oxohepta-3-ene-1,7-dioic acid hydratase in catechol pathway